MAAVELERVTQRAREDVRVRVTTAAGNLGVLAAAAAAAGEAAAELAGVTLAASSKNQEVGETRLVVHQTTPNPYVTPRAEPATHNVNGAPPA